MFCFLDIAVGNNSPRRVVLKLHSDVCPKTCQNFKDLCVGKGVNYAGSPIHRVQPGAFIQGGDVVSGHGDGGASATGGAFEDENYVVKHDAPYILGMANAGRHTNTSQFYITLKPLPKMDTKFVAIGRVVDGTDTIDAVGAAAVGPSGRPLQPIVIVRAGHLDSFEE